MPAPAGVGDVSAVLGAGSSPRASEGRSQCVWGVDPSSRKVAIAWNGEDRGADRVLFTYPLDAGARLADIHEQTVELARRLAPLHPPAYVFVEQIAIYSKRIDPILYYATGTITAALYGELARHFKHPVTVEFVPSATWKKRAIGYGGVKSHDILPWALRDGYEGADADEAAAWGIALAGVKLLEPAPEQLELG